MEITISGNDKNRLEQIENMAKKLGLTVSKKITSHEGKNIKNGGLFELMEEMAATGGIQSIEDPTEWQRDIRKDRSLPGRK